MCCCFDRPVAGRNPGDAMKLQLHAVLLLCLFLPAVPAVLADYPIEVIALQSRTVDEVLPLLQPFVGSDATLTGMGSRLVIKAAPRQVDEIRQLLAELDRPPRQLRITVDKDDDTLRGSRGYNASADIKLGDNSQISINSPGKPVDSSRAHVQLRDRSTTTTRTSKQFVQAMEGQPAYISSGLRVPLRTTDGYYGAGGPYYRSTTQLYDVTGGFYVVPRVSGEVVTLEIMQHDDRPGRQRGVIDTQRVNTQVQGRLGDWIDLGGLDQSEASQQDGIGRSINSQQGQLQGIRVKVECVNC